MQIAMSKTREQFPLSTRKVLKKTISETIIYAILLIIISIFFVAMGLFERNLFNSYLGTVAIGALCLVLIITILVYSYQKWYYATYFYDLTEDHVVIRKSPLTPREITIPYERIQDVYVDQDIFDRIFGLYDVHLSSATASSGMEAHIDGVEKMAAEGIRTALLQNIQEKIGKKKD